MKRRNLGPAICMMLAVSASGILNAAAQANASAPPPDYAKLLPGIREEILAAMKRDKVPGVSVAVVSESGVVWTEGFGVVDGPGSARVTPETFFSIQSITKSITATAIMAAVQDGLVDLDAPITTYLPDFTINSRFEENAAGTITLRLLLNHRAGLTHEAPVGNNYDPSSPSFEDHVRSISDTWLKYPVGERHIYSNLGMDLAGYVLERASGMPFEEYVRTRLLAPLGMSRSTFDADTITLRVNRAVGHDAYFTRIPMRIPMVAAGGLWSNAVEMARFVRFHLGRGAIDGAAIVDSALIGEMYRIPYPVEGQTEGYALGVLRRPANGSYVVFHRGGGFGFSTVAMWYPEHGLGLVILANGRSYALSWATANSILARLIEERLGGKPPETREEPPKPLGPQPGAETLEKLAGHYWNDDRGSVHLRIQKGMLGLLSGKTIYPLVFYAPEKAFFVYGGTVNRIEFVMTPEGLPRFFIDLADGNGYDFNDGPAIGRGPGSREWRRCEGRYRYRTYGVPSGMRVVREKNGWLYLDDLRLEEREPGLFFTVSGEAIDFRQAVPTAGNVRLERLGIPFWQEAIFVLALAAFGIALVSWMMRFMRGGEIGGAAGAGAVAAGEKRRREPLARIAVATGIVTGCLSLGFAALILVRYPFLVSYGLEWNARFPIAMKVLYWIPLACAILAMDCLTYTAVAWIKRYWSTTERICYTLAAAASVAAVALLAVWRVLALPF